MAKANKFSVGGVVKLKSGGPDMTIQIAHDGPIKTYHCQRFAGKKLESGTFPEESLEEVKTQ